MNVGKDITQLIGKTPLVKLNKVTDGAKANVYAKLEFFNPGSSVKDRLALAMITDAEEKKLITSDTVIIEPTSGNTGVGLAMIAAVKGYKFIAVMPESASVERRKVMKGFGAELVLTPPEKGMKGSIQKAEELQKENPNSFIPMQFENSSNVEFHKKTTAIEIWEDTDGTVDLFVAGVGTGGTFSGVSTVLKEKKDTVKSIAVEPIDSAVLSGNDPAPHKIQGIGAGFIPKNCYTDLIDGIEKIENEEAFNMAKRLMKEEGILCGISSGANVVAAVKQAQLPENEGKNIVVIICDTGERYLSTSLFD